MAFDALLLGRIINTNGHGDELHVMPGGKDEQFAVVFAADVYRKVFFHLFASFTSLSCILPAAM